MKKILKLSGSLLAGLLVVVVGVFAAAASLVNLNVTGTVSWFAGTGVNAAVSAKATNAKGEGATTFSTIAEFTTENIPTDASFGAITFDSENKIAYIFTFKNYDQNAKLNVTVTASLTTPYARLSFEGSGVLETIDNASNDGAPGTADVTITLKFDTNSANKTDIINAGVNFAVRMEVGEEVGEG